jgi:hypothetical protein
VDDARRANALWTAAVSRPRRPGRWRGRCRPTASRRGCAGGRRR